jgi:hypothetical protein
MENLRNVVIQNQPKVRYALLGCAGIAAFNCLTRPDFNLIVYLYIFYVWYIMNNNKVLYI